MRQHLIWLFTSLLIGAAPASADADATLYRQAFQSLYEAGQFNGAVLIAKDDKIVLDAFFGDADKLENKPLTANSLYRLASVSKTITATALLSLVDAGKVKLDDKVRTFLPAFPYPGITVRHLLQHDSGLPDYIFGVGDYWDDSKGQMSNRDVLDWLVKRQPTQGFKEGEGWEYSNTGYALIPLIIEAVTQQRYPAFVRQSVLDKAGMQHSFHISELGADERPNVARGHGFDYGTGKDLRADKHFMLAAEFNTDGVYGAGDIYSTARDMFLFDQALKAGKLLSDQLQKQAYTSLILPEGFPAGYGLGWQVAESPFTGHIIHHHGQGDGYRTRYYRFLDKGITIVTLENAREKYADEAVRVAQQLAFKNTYTLPKASLAEALSRAMSDGGTDGTFKLVASAAEAPDQWSLDERDLNNFALTFWYQGKQDLAIQLFTHYLKLMPTRPSAYSTLAEALQETGDHAASKAYYEKALAVANQEPQTYAREIATLKKLVGKAD